MAVEVKKGDNVTFKTKHREGAGVVTAVRQVTKGQFIDIEINGGGNISVRPVQVQRAA